MTLLEHLVPQAWIKLLENMVEKHPDRSAFHLWPREPPERREMWDSLCSLIISRVSNKACPIWYTDVGYVSLSDGLVASENDFLEQRQAFHDAGLPVIYLSETILKHAKNNHEARKLCQQTVLECLRSSNRLIVASIKSKLILLEYLSYELPLTEFADLAIFPFEDGTLRAINQHKVFLHRDDSERKLFVQAPEHNLDSSKVSAGLLKQLQQQAAKPLSYLRLRKPKDLQEYCDKTIYKFKKLDRSIDMIDADQELHSFVGNSWRWITLIRSSYSTQRLLTAISSLWLLPLTNGKLRKMQPESASLFITYTTRKHTKDIMLKIASLESRSAPLMLDLDAFPE